MDFTKVFCDVDDFIKTRLQSQAQCLPLGKPRRGPVGRLALSEILTILIGYHQSSYRHFKAYYLYLIFEGKMFPTLVSYNRFVELIPYAWMPLMVYIESRKGICTGISYIDSTSIAVCKNIRIPRNKVFANFAKRGKSTTGWFFGFKLHLIVNEIGDILAYHVTQGNKHDASVVEKMCGPIFGKLFGDKGYIGQRLVENLRNKNIALITNLKSNMKNKLIPLMDKILLRKRFIIETIHDQLKNISDLEHSRHRSPINFCVNLLCALIAYTFQPKKPAIKFNYTSTLIPDLLLA